MILSPLTWIVLLVAGVLLIIGGILIGGARPTTTGEQRTCPHPDCKARNPRLSKFCSRCGRPMDDAPTSHGSFK